MDKKTFFDKCKHHDWYFQFSDDSRVYQAGLRAQGELRRIQDEDSELALIYDSWKDYFFSGKTFNTPQTPKPTYEQFGISEDRYDCPIHGLQDGSDCPRC